MLPKTSARAYTSTDIHLRQAHCLGRSEFNRLLMKRCIQCSKAAAQCSCGLTVNNPTDAAERDAQRVANCSLFCCNQNPSRSLAMRDAMR